MAKFRVLIADSRYDSYSEEEHVLSGIDAEIVHEKSDDENKIAALAGDIDGLIVNLALITPKIIGAMTRCKCVSRYGIGYDNVNVDALNQKGIMLLNVPGYCVEDVSDHAMALLLDCVRKISRKDRHVRAGEWNLSGLQSVRRISGKTFGFVGYGAIARIFHRKLSGFNLGRVLVSDPVVTTKMANDAGVELVDLTTICRESDYISLHTPVLPSTRGMIGSEQFAIMKGTAILINTARGPLVDETALVEALKTGRIACAGLDTFVNEPLESDSELLKLDNVTLTDHAGWYSEESQVELQRMAAENVALVLTGRAPISCVNAKELGK
ncbi:MAG: C-terminal binding protein [Lentisphaerae bacterium]|nr:C-terminal binding protein [Lentisphaerota bacterium]